MADISKQPGINNGILGDVEALREMLIALFRNDPSVIAGLMEGVRRMETGPNGLEFEVFNGQAWNREEKAYLDVTSVGGFLPSQSADADTVAVRDKNGALPGDILGNAATASEAAALSEVNPIEMGGTGGSTAAKARENLVVPPKNHASSSTDYGLGTSTQYGHTQPHDEPDATLTADAGHAFSPAGAASLKTALEGQIGNVETGASQQVSALNSALRALIQQELAKYLPLTGGTMTGDIVKDSHDIVVRHATNAGQVTFRGGRDYQGGADIVLFGKDFADSSLAGTVLLRSYTTSNNTDVHVRGEGLYVEGYSVLTSAGGSLTGTLTTSNIIPLASDNSERGLVIFGGVGWEDGYIHLAGQNAVDKNCYLVSPTVNGSKTYFAVEPGGRVTVNSSPVLTAANGLLLNSGNVQVFSCPTGGGWTAPAGGTWAYLICGEFNAQNIYGVVAGGTYVAWPNSGHPAQGIAFRIAN